MAFTHPPERPTPGHWPRRRWALLLALVFAPLALQYLGRFRAAAWVAVAVVGVLLADAIGGQRWGVLSGAALTMGVLSGAWILASRMQQAREFGALLRPAGSRWGALLLTGIVALLLATLGRALIVEPMRVPSGSMMPGLRVGQTVWVWKFGGGLTHAWGEVLHRGSTRMALQRGDLIVFEAPPPSSPFGGGPLYLKRLVALPGDLVEVRAHRRWVNGQPTATGSVTSSAFDTARSFGLDTEEEQLDGRRYRVATRTHAPSQRHADMAPKRVPPGQLFVLGDHRDNAVDGRLWGMLDQRQLVGRVREREPGTL